MIHLGTTDGKKITFSNRKLFDSDLSQLDGRIEIEIRKAKKHRSTNQNAFLWSCVYPLAAQGFIDLGNEGVTVDLVHRLFKDKFIEREKDLVIPLTGEVFRTKTTTDLSTTEMMAYIENISRFCAEFLNVIIPEPNNHEATR